MEGFPYLGGLFSLVYFIGFALKVPMHSRLVKESAISVVLGMATASLYPYYYKRVYVTNVVTVYNDLRKAIKLNPALAKPDSDTEINKNFGPSKWNTSQSGMDSEDDIEMDGKMGIMDGHADDEGKANVRKVFENF